MLNFNGFLFEKLGVPSEIRPYEDIIYKRILEHLNLWIGRKRFANYNIDVDIPWIEIKDEITEEEFKAFPLEEITLHIKFNISSYTKGGSSFTGWQYSFSKKKRPGELAYWIRSKSGIIKRALLLDMMVGMDVLKYEPLDIDFAKKQLKYTIRHELLHAFENMVNKNFEKEWIGSGMWDIAEHWDLNYKKSVSTRIFWKKFYFASDPELRARVSEADLESVESKTVSDVIDMLSMSADEIVEGVKEELNITEEDKYFKDFGKLFIKIYKKACKVYHIEPSRKILKLENKNLAEIADYFEPMYKRKLEYFKRKIAKRMTLVDVEI